MPCHLRPDEWRVWISTGKRQHALAPRIDEPEEFGMAISKWWEHLRSLDSTRAKIKKSGSNGLVSLILLLLWWGRAASQLPDSSFQGDSLPMWNGIIKEVGAAVRQMLSPSSESPTFETPASQADPIVPLSSDEALVCGAKRKGVLDQPPPKRSVAVEGLV